MSCKIIPTKCFERELKRLAKKFPSLKNEFAKLIGDININPEAGTFIGNNCYKIRLATQSKGKGKRSGMRVINYFDKTTKVVYMMNIYDKGEKANLKPSELKGMIDSLELDIN